MTFGAKQHFDNIKMLGGRSLSKKSCKDFFDKLCRRVFHTAALLWQYYNKNIAPIMISSSLSPLSRYMR